MINVPIIHMIISLINFVLPWSKLDHNHDLLNAIERSTTDHDRYLRETKFDLRSIVFDLQATVDVTLHRSATDLQEIVVDLHVLEDKLRANAVEIVTY